MRKCIFCEIAEERHPNTRLLFRDDKTLAFLDISPLTLCHTLVIPIRHSENLYHINEEDIQAVSLTISRITKALKSVLECDGVNILQNNESYAGQVIFHTHFHIIPRFFGDSIRILRGTRKPLNDDPSLISKIRHFLNEY